MNNLITPLRNFTLLVAGLLLFSSQAIADKADVESELQRYIKLFTTNDFSQLRPVFDELAWSGISDPRLYDVIEKQLLEQYQTETTKIGLDHSAWLAKTLAYSGNTKYLKTYDQILNDDSDRKLKKIKKHVTRAQQQLPKYKSWNPQIAKGLERAPKGRLDQQRVINMINSDDAELIRVGAKRVYYKYTQDAALVEAAKERLLADYKQSDVDKTYADALAWLCKALAETGDAGHKAALEEVAENAGSRKVAKYAKKYAKYL